MKENEQWNIILKTSAAECRAAESGPNQVDLSSSAKIYLKIVFFKVLRLSASHTSDGNKFQLVIA